MSLDNTRKVLKELITLATIRVDDKLLNEIAEKAQLALAERPKLFVLQSGDGSVRDVASDDITEVDIYVIDETSRDADGAPATLDTEDGGSFTAHIKAMSVTPVHFEADQVVAATESTFANGTKL